MTPQTLESDLARENFDIRDVVLVVLGMPSLLRECTI